MSVIRNFEELGTTKLRRDALAILEAGYRAIQTKTVMTEQVIREGHLLRVQGVKINTDEYKRVFIIGIGKCALDACAVLEEMLEDRLSGGMVLDVRGAVLKKLQSHVGTHPFPSERNVAAARSVADLVDGLTEDDLLLSVISGGGSALLCLPNDLGCSELVSFTKTLMDNGATINELNTVRKHMSQLQGGQLAERAYPARVVSLIFSDVPGDDLSVVASGPTVKDTTTVDDARSVLMKYGLLNACTSPLCTLVETPKEDTYFERVTNILLLSNKTALEAMQEHARALGYTASIETNALEGRAREVARRLVDDAHGSRYCRLYGGEVTVIVNNPNGKGGRNQELALAALPHTSEGAVLVAAASDGWDNGDVAGALADARLRQKAREMNVSITEHLEANTSYSFFKSVGGHIMTGKTGANVSDLYFTLTA